MFNMWRPLTFGVSALIKKILYTAWSSFSFNALIDVSMQHAGYLVQDIGFFWEGDGVSVYCKGTLENSGITHEEQTSAK